jgi:hypothetical protein
MQGELRELGIAPGAGVAIKLDQLIDPWVSVHFSGDGFDAESVERGTNVERVIAKRPVPQLDVRDQMPAP